MAVFINDWCYSFVFLNISIETCCISDFQTNEIVYVLLLYTYQTLPQLDRKSVV